jgi:hypothetical protein
VNETNKIVNELVDLYTGKVVTQHENEVLFRVVKLIRDLEDQSKMYKSLLATNESSTTTLKNPSQTP